MVRTRWESRIATGKRSAIFSAGIELHFCSFFSGKERNLNIIEVVCSTCSKFFHESCIGYQMGKLLAFSMNYNFTCKFCSATGLEQYRRTSASFPQMCITTIANLQRKTVKDGSPRFFFSKEKEIVPFIESYWESMTTMARKQTTGWHGTILKTLQAHSNIFTSQDNAGDLMFGLVDRDLETIKPSYENLKLNQKEDGE